MGRIPEEDVARVRDAIDLVQLVSETVTLKKRGRLMWGNCPFHGEKTPSFKIDPATQLWHCFGCGRGGDVFGYVMELEQLEFPDAVRHLAERARIEIRESGGRGIPIDHRERLIAASEEAATFFYRALTTSRDAGAAAAREYLACRGFGLDVAKRWRLGYAPQGRDRLTRHLTRAGFTREEIVDANLAMINGATLRDRFYNRIMFPITDASGRVIAFGGRVVGSGEPKYLNTQETPVFHKSAHLYALDRSRAEIVASGTAVVVEGYTDVIAMHEAGITSAVATLGTALTERHMKLLGRFGQRVVYLFDGDEAGRRAALRAVEFLDWSATPEAGSSRIDLDVALIPGGMDPADLVAAEGPDALRRVIDGAVPLVRFVLDVRLAGHDLTHPEGRSAALVDAAAVLEPLRGSLLGQDYMNYLAGRLQTDYATVQRAVPQKRRSSADSGASRQSEIPQTHSAPLPAEIKAERELVRIAAMVPTVRERARNLLNESAIVDDTTKRLLELLVEADGAIDEELFVFITARDRAAAELLSGWLVDAPRVEQVEYRFQDIVMRVRDFALGRTIRSKKAELSALDPADDKERYDALFGEIAELQRRQQVLRAHKAGGTDAETEHNT